MTRYQKTYKKALFDLQQKLIKFQTEVANANEEPGYNKWQHEDVEEIQNTINLIDKYYKLIN